MNDYTGTLELQFSIEKAEKPSVETSIYLSKSFQNLSEVELPQYFEWVEDSMQVVSKNKMTAMARYVGEDAEFYKNTLLTFEIVISESEDNLSPGTSSTSQVWIYYLIAGVVVLILAGAVVVIVSARKNSSSKTDAK